MPHNEIRTGKIEQLSISDWDQIIQIGRRHNSDWSGVIPLLYKCLMEHCSKANIPASIMWRLKEAYLHTAKRNKHLYQELSQILFILKNNNIPVIVLKGAYLAEIIYANIALRPMYDIDLLVRKRDLPMVERELLKRGYGPLDRHPIEEQYKRKRHLIPFVKNRVRTEIHWTIVPVNNTFQIDLDEMWERARPILIGDIEVLGLSPEDLILQLCLNTIKKTIKKRFRGRLYTLHDISETIQYHKAEIKWELILHRAFKWHCKNSTYMALHLARGLLAAAVPDEVLDGMKVSPKIESLTKQVHNHFFSDDNSLPKRSIFDFKMGDFPRDKMRYLFFLVKKVAKQKLYHLLHMFPPSITTKLK